MPPLQPVHIASGIRCEPNATRRGGFASAANVPERDTPSRSHRESFGTIIRVAVPTAVLLIPLLLLLVPPGENPGAGHMVYHPSTKKYEFVHDRTPINTLGAGLGIVGGYLLLLSPILSYRVPIGWLIPAPRRLRLHRWVGVLLLSVSLGHAAILPIVGFYQGWLTGIVALVLLALHGALGAWRTPFVRSWGAARYRYLFLWTAWAAFLMVLVHSPGVGLVEHYGLRARIFELLNPLA